MLPYKIGNWEINIEGIVWKGNQVEFLIPKEELSLLRRGGNERIYDWLSHPTTKQWINENDIYALNTAYVFAMEYFKINFHVGSFVDTFIAQQDIISEKNHLNEI